MARTTEEARRPGAPMRPLQAPVEPPQQPAAPAQLEVSTVSLDKLLCHRALAQWQQEADKLGRALKEKGVCLVELDAVSAFAVEELQGGAETFFARDAASKAACTGYVVGTGKQMYHHSPTTEQPRELEDRLVTAHSALQGVARVLLQSLCRSQVLKLRADAMTTLLDDVPLPAGDAPASALSCFAYPAHAAVDPPTMGADAHVDRGMLTLVMASPQQHLQVETAAGVWSAVPASGGAMTAVVMVGRTLEHATGGVLKATTHRVPHAPVGRQSVAFHQRAHRAATLDTTMLWAAGHDVPARYANTTTVAALMSQFTHSINAPAAAAGAAAGFAQTPDLLPDLKGKGSKREREPEVDPKVINITVLGQDGSAIDFKVRQTIQLGRVFEAYCTKRGLIQSSTISCMTAQNFKELIHPTISTWKTATR